MSPKLVTVVFVKTTDILWHVRDCYKGRRRRIFKSGVAKAHGFFRFVT